MRTLIVRDAMRIPIGRQGENEAQRVVWPDIVTGWAKLYGDGVFSLAVKRKGDTAPYPVTVTTEDGALVWVPTNADTAVAGSGSCELSYTVDDVLAKSQTWSTEVYSSLTGEGETEPPEPYQSWVDQVVAVGAAAQASADAAKADADRATELAAEVSKKAAQTAQDASDAAKAMKAAQTAQRLADEAQGAAETARTAAAAAQAAAEHSATDAAGAKQDAVTALKSAQDAAAAAAKALADIRTLYQEMQTWAQGVIQDVDAAGSAAVQSVQSAGDTQVQRVTDEGATQTANAKAQADAAAQSAAGAAQSAQEASESAAVYDTVVADVTQLKQDIAGLEPSGATVGQLFRVAAISEDGKYTMEPVDMLDVRVDGESIVQDGVAIIPFADGFGKAGIVRLANSLGVKWSNENGGGLSIDYATIDDISRRVPSNRPIISHYIDYAVKAAMCDGKGEAWTTEEQAAARARMAVENGADFELLVDATLEEEANTFTVVFPKPVRECIYHVWFYNNNGESAIAQTRCLDNGTTSYYLLKNTNNIKDGYGYVLNGYFRYNGPINGNSVTGYAADAQTASWTTDNLGNGNIAYTSYPKPIILQKVDGLKLQLMNESHVLNVGATIKAWGR